MSTTGRKGSYRWVWLLPLFLSACGFHLRGTVLLPVEMAQTYVEAGKYPDLARALRDQLQGSNVTLVSSVSVATAVIRLQSESRSRRILSVDSNGQANAYELVYQVSFDLVDMHGESLLPTQSLSRSRDLNLSGDNLLGKSREEQQIYDTLLLNMASAILQRIQYARLGTAQ